MQISLLGQDMQDINLVVPKKSIDWTFNFKVLKKHMLVHVLLAYYVKRMKKNV